MDKGIGISVREVLELAILKDARFLGGRTGLDNKVLSVNVMEVPDILNWVSPGELLLTTAYSIKDDINVLMDLLPRMKKSGVVGIGIKTERFIGKIPKDIIERAEDLGFPIFEIPVNISFSEIITPILKGIINYQMMLVERMQDLQQELIDIMLNGGNLQELSKLLYEYLGNSIGIFNEQFLSYVISTTPEKEADIARIIVNERIKLLEGGFEVSKETERLEDADCIDGQTYSRLMIPIFSGNEHYGYIYIWEDNNLLTEMDMLTVKSATSLVALDMLKRSAVHDMANSHKVGFVEDILSREDYKFQRAMKNAEYFNFNQNLEHRIMFIRLKIPGKNKGISNEHFYRISNHVVILLRQLSKRYLYKPIYVNKLEHILVICENSSVDPKDSEALFKKFVESFWKQIKQRNLQEFVKIGIGRPYRDAAQLHRSFEEAKQAAIALGQEDAVNYYQDMGVYRLLTSESLRQEYQLLYKEYFQKLVDYDEERDTKLVKTIQAYFECNGNLQKVADMLYLHYNTVAYRMGRIKKMINIDFDNADERFLLQTLLKIYEITADEK